MKELLSFLLELFVKCFFFAKSAVRQIKWAFITYIPDFAKAAFAPPWVYFTIIGIVCCVVAIVIQIIKNKIKYG